MFWFVAFKNTQHNVVFLQKLLDTKAIYTFV